MRKNQFNHSMEFLNKNIISSEAKPMWVNNVQQQIRFQFYEGPCAVPVTNKAYKEPCFD